jgi:hypothetical protein
MAVRFRMGLCLLVAVPLLAIASQAPAPPSHAPDPFASFRPWLDITADDRTRADRGETVVRILPARGGEVAVLGVAAIAVEPDAFVARIEAIEALRTNPPRAPITKRFSQPPVPGDLAALRLDPHEVASLRRCHPGDCDLKLTEPEIARLREVAGAAGAGLEEMVQQAFRQVIFERITRYLEGGFAALPPYVDKDDPIKTSDVLARLLEHSPYFIVRAPHLATFVRQFPRATIDGGNGFLYWALDRVEDRPVVSATHVAIVRNPPASGLPLVAVAGTQVFATHYYQGSLGLTYLVGTTPRYLLYVNRTELDVLGGFFGSIKRAILEGRLRRDVARLIGGLRGRLEGRKDEE